MHDTCRRSIAALILAAALVACDDAVVDPRAPGGAADKGGGDRDGRDDGSDDDDGGDADGSGDDGTGGHGTGGDGDDQDDGAAWLVDTCVAACAVAADCSLGLPAYDADNYACVAGGCVYAGCNTEAECDALDAQGTSFTCGASGYCELECATPADCSNGAGAYGPDHYACTNGVCAYLGCTSDADCVAANNGTSVCVALADGFRTCRVACDVPADCAVDGAPFDADNYACEQGGCRWTGCHTDAECGAWVDGYVCRAP